MKSKKNFRLKIYNIKRSHQLNETALSQGDSGVSLRSTRRTAECLQVLRPISVENTGRGLSPVARICHTGPVDVFIEVEVYGKNHVSYSLLVFGLPCSVMLRCDNEPGVACLHLVGLYGLRVWLSLGPDLPRLSQHTGLSGRPFWLLQCPHTSWNALVIG